MSLSSENKNIILNYGVGELSSYLKNMNLPAKSLDVEIFSDFDNDQKKKSILFVLNQVAHRENAIGWTWRRSKLGFCLIKTIEENKDFSFDSFIIAKDLLESDSYNDLRYLMINASCYSSVSIFDKLVDDCDPRIRRSAAKLCSIRKLTSLKKSKDSKVREIVYSRLGPVDNLDDSLKDRSKDVRGWALDLCPHQYVGLKKMTEERSAYNFEKIVKKVALSDLPFFVTSKLFNNKNVGKWIKDRIRSSIKERLE